MNKTPWLADGHDAVPMTPHRLDGAPR